MFRVGAGILRYRTTASWAAAPGSTARWSGRVVPRFQSTASAPLTSGASESGVEASTPNGAATKAKEAKVSQAMLAKDAQTDELLNKALLEALEDIQNESPDSPPTVQGYTNPPLPDPVPPTSPYDPTLLPLAPTPAFLQNPFHNPLTSPHSFPKPLEQQWHASLIRGRSISPAFHHPRTYSLPSASLHLRSYHPKLLDFFAHFAEHAAASLGIPVSKVVRLPTQRSLWTVPRSPFAHKKSQENFERRTHKRVVKAWDAHEEVVDVWIRYLRKHALGGVGMRVTTWRRAELGYGRKRVEEVQKRLSGGEGMGQDGGKKVPQEKIRGLAEKIVKEELLSAVKKAPAVQAP